MYHSSHQGQFAAGFLRIPSNDQDRLSRRDVIARNPATFGSRMAGSRKASYSRKLGWVLPTKTTGSCPEHSEHDGDSQSNSCPLSTFLINLVLMPREGTKSVLLCSCPDSPRHVYAPRDKPDYHVLTTTPRPFPPI